MDRHYIVYLPPNYGADEALLDNFKCPAANPSLML